MLKGDFMIIKLHKQITIKCSAFVISLCFLFLTGCCSPQYSYYNCRKRGEEALIAKKFIKARNYYSLIYKNENKAKKCVEALKADYPKTFLCKPIKIGCSIE